MFAELFRRQVYAPNVGDEVVRECLQVTASHNRKVSSTFLVCDESEAS
jgi:hypothetical protein